jgi:hypothetical protein
VRRGDVDGIYRGVSQGLFQGGVNLRDAVLCSGFFQVLRVAIYEATHFDSVVDFAQFGDHFGVTRSGPANADYRNFESIIHSD